MAINEGTDALKELKESIAEFGSRFTVVREAAQLGGKWGKTSSRIITFMPLMEASALYPGMLSQLGINNQADVSNHDIFYCTPDTQISETIDAIMVDGVRRMVTKISQPRISNVIVVKMVYVMKDAQ